MSQQRKSRLVPEVDFAKDGKQTGFIRLFHSTHDSAYGFLPVPLAVMALRFLAHGASGALAAPAAPDREPPP